PTVGSGAGELAYSSASAAVTPTRDSTVASTSTPNRNGNSSQLTPPAIRPSGTPCRHAASTHESAVGTATIHSGSPRSARIGYDRMLAAVMTSTTHAGPASGMTVFMRPGAGA